MLPRRRVLHRTPFEERPPREGSRRWLVAELDRLTSVVVRRRDRRCVTCGETRRLQCSHFYSRRHLALRFDLRNCNAMCAECNRRHNADPSEYFRFMNERYGEAEVAELDSLRRDGRKVTNEDLLQTLERLRREVWPADSAAVAAALSERHGRAGRVIVYPRRLEELFCLFG